MAFRMGDNDNGGMNEINLIPLIDIMLVLMIIFMVTASVMQPSIPLTLPKTSASPQGSQNADIIQISINKDNNIYIEQNELSIEQLSATLVNARNSAEPSNMPSINIRADKQSNYDAIANVLATASEVGLTDIAFISDSE